MRRYRCFHTTQERSAWEREQKQKNQKFRVCMRMTARQLERDLYMENGTLSEFAYATVYRFTE